MPDQPKPARPLVHPWVQDQFIRSHEAMAAEIEGIVQGYPPEMRGDLRDHALEVMRVRLQEMWNGPTVVIRADPPGSDRGDRGHSDL